MFSFSKVFFRLLVPSFVCCFLIIVQSALAESPVEQAASSSAEGSLEKPVQNVTIAIGSEYLAPEDISVSPGTTVAWINQADDIVKVRFTTNAVSTTCKAPRGFGIGPEGIFNSDKIASGGVASLCFLEPNEYEYAVDYLVNEGPTASVLRTIIGKVIVKQ